MGKFDVGGVESTIYNSTFEYKSQYILKTPIFKLLLAFSCKKLSIEIRLNNFME